MATKYGDRHDHRVLALAVILSVWAGTIPVAAAPTKIDAGIQTTNLDIRSLIAEIKKEQSLITQAVSKGQLKVKKRNAPECGWESYESTLEVYGQSGSPSLMILTADGPDDFHGVYKYYYKDGEPISLIGRSENPGKVDKHRCYFKSGKVLNHEAACLNFLDRAGKLLQFYRSNEACRR